MSAYMCVSLRMHVYMSSFVYTHICALLRVGRGGGDGVGEGGGRFVVRACTSVAKYVFVLSCLSAHVCARAYVCVCV